MIKIYGASDDCIEVAGCQGADEYSAAGHLFERVAWHGDLIAPGVHATEQMRVHAIFDGCWHFSVGQVMEDVPLAPWPLRFQQGTDDESPYSVVLWIDAPDETRLDNIWPARDNDDA